MNFPVASIIAGAGSGTVTGIRTASGGYGGGDPRAGAVTKPHARLEVDGKVGRLRSDLYHFSNENIDHLLVKISQFSTMFVQQYRRQGRRVGWIDLTVRPIWRFLRAYIFRLGFLDGWPGYLIAWANAFGAVVRYAKVKEAEVSTGKAPDPP